MYRYRYLSNESTLSCRDAGFPPNVTRVRGFLVTTGSTGLSDPDECCFSIFRFYELSLAGCECITVYCVRFESLGSHFCLCVCGRLTASCSASAAAAAADK